MEFPITVKDRTVYFGARFDLGAGGGHLVIDPEAMFTKVGLIIPMSYRALVLIDSIETNQFNCDMDGSSVGIGCVVINSEGQVHQVMCTKNTERKEDSDDPPHMLIKLRIPVGDHTTFVGGVDQHVMIPQLLAAMGANLSTTDAYEALAELQNLTQPHLVQFPISYVVSRLKELGYTDTIVSKRFDKFVNDMVNAHELQKKMDEKITTK